MVNENAKLVFTTDSNNNAVNRQYFQDELANSASDVKTEMDRSIIELNKSKRRHIMTPVKSTTGKRDESLKNRLEIGDRIIREIFNNPTSFRDLMKKLFSSLAQRESKVNITLIRNILGQIRVATKFIVFYKKHENVWMIHPGYSSGLPSLIEAWHKNHGDMWRRSKDKNNQKSRKERLDNKIHKEVINIPTSGTKPELVINCGGTVITINKSRITIDIG